MYKIIITAFICFVATTLYSQSNRFFVYKNFEIINGDTVNYKSDDNIKNGYWIYYKVGLRAHSDFGNPDDYVEYKDYLYLISEGNYVNNKKVGLWKFYSDYKTYETQYVEKTVIYNKEEQKDSVSTEYYGENIVKSRTYWNAGKIDSLKVFYDTGSIKCVAKHKEGVLDIFYIYYPEGNLKYVGKEIENYKVLNLERYNSEGEEMALRDNDLSAIAMLENLMNYLDWSPKTDCK